MLIALHKNARTRPAIFAHIALHLWRPLTHSPSFADGAHACARGSGGAPAAYILLLLLLLNDLLAVTRGFTYPMSRVQAWIGNQAHDAENQRHAGAV